MQAVMEQSEVVKSMQAALAATRKAPEVIHTGPAVDSKPLIGGEINIHIALSPGMIALISAPVTVLATMLLAWLTMTTLGAPLFAHEMFAGAIVNTIGGVAASLPLFILMKRGAAVIAQAGILGIALRIGAVLMGMLIAGATPWGLDRVVLAYWVMGFYAPLLIAETAVVAWLSNKAKH